MSCSPYQSIAIFGLDLECAMSEMERNETKQDGTGEDGSRWTKMDQDGTSKEDCISDSCTYKLYILASWQKSNQDRDEIRHAIQIQIQVRDSKSENESRPDLKVIHVIA